MEDVELHMKCKNIITCDLYTLNKANSTVIVLDIQITFCCGIPDTVNSFKSVVTVENSQSTLYCPMAYQLIPHS